jgi:polysaccharide export outer membrane protein
MNMRTLVANAFVGALLLCAVPCASFSQPAPATDNAASDVAAPVTGVSDRDYILGPDDVVEANVLGRSDFKARSKVGQDGKITVPYLGSIAAAHKTTTQLADDLRAALIKGGYYADPILSVDIVSYASRTVIVLGDVLKPGLIPVDRPYRLSELLARVGGVKEGAADYIVVRSDQGPERHFSVKQLATGDLQQDPYIEPGEKIYSPKGETFYISGQVRTPGTFPIAEDMTLRQAIARAGGLSETGSDHGVKVTHANGKKGKLKLEDKVQPDDVIIIGEKLF